MIYGDRAGVPEVCTYAEAMVLKGIKQERDNTKREKQRADAAEARIRELEAQLAASGKKKNDFFIRPEKLGHFYIYQPI